MKNEALMNSAIEIAKYGALNGEVPIGAIITYQGEIIASSHNLVESEKNVARHAEIIVIERASKFLENWRLTNCSLYVTLEPCPMCMSAIRFSRISKVVFGAYDPRLGACGSHINLANDPDFGALPEVIGGVLKENCVSLLQDFFKSRRKESKN